MTDPANVLVAGTPEIQPSIHDSISESHALYYTGVEVSVIAHLQKFKHTFVRDVCVWSIDNASIAPKSS